MGLAPSNFLQLLEPAENEAATQAAAVPSVPRRGPGMPSPSAMVGAAVAATGASSQLTRRATVTTQRASELVVPEDAMVQAMAYPWFHPGIERLAAEQRVRDSPAGAFLVRESQTPPDFTLTVRGEERVLNLKIRRIGAVYYLGEFSQCVCLCLC
jgi:hypothetical protein